MIVSTLPLITKKTEQKKGKFHFDLMGITPNVNSHIQLGVIVIRELRKTYHFNSKKLFQG